MKMFCEKNIKRIQAIQNKAAKIILGDKSIGKTNQTCIIMVDCNDIRTMTRNAICKQKNKILFINKSDIYFQKFTEGRNKEHFSGLIRRPNLITCWRKRVIFSMRFSMASDMFEPWPICRLSSENMEMQCGGSCAASAAPSWEAMCGELQYP